MPSFEIEEKLGNFIIGIDEAGRGPLVGPVYASACYINRKLFPQNLLKQITDSKKLSEIKREKIFDDLQNLSSEIISFGIGFSDVIEIDTHNILNATMLAMSRAFQNLITNNVNFIPDYIIVDGNKAPEFSHPHKTIIKGDNLCYSISTASIIAKVSRDRYIRTLSEKFPEYNWHKNKGYGTKDHIDAIKQFGFTSYHRKSFKIYV